jgi:serine/threonine protein kinase
MIEIRCACGRSLKAPDGRGERRVKCPACGQSLLIPVTQQETRAGGETRAEPTAGTNSVRAATPASATGGMPTRLAHYDVLRKLGAGAMGEVYLGRDRLLEREVAIKVLPRDLATDQTRLDRFVREAQAAARLNHAHAVTVYQVGVEDGLPFLVMEVMDGGSLADAVAEAGPMDWREATRAIRGAAAGLGAAHEAGLIHRDIKPANLMRTAKGIVKVADFGLAKSQAQSTQLTQVGAAIGTPAFMAPEQWRGAEPDPRSDLYALTCTYYALLTGRPPFEAPSVPAVMYQHLTQPPPNPRQFAQWLPDAVCQMLARGTQKNPAARYQSANELLADLDRLLAIPPQTLTYRGRWEEQLASGGSPLPASPFATSAVPSSGTRSRHFSVAGEDSIARRLSRPPVLIGGAAAIGALLLVGLLWMLLSRDDPPATPLNNVNTASTASTPAPESATEPGSNSSADSATVAGMSLPLGTTVPGQDQTSDGQQQGNGVALGDNSPSYSAPPPVGGPGMATPDGALGGPIGGPLGPGGQLGEQPANRRFPAWSARQAIGPPDVSAEAVADGTGPNGVLAPGGFQMGPSVDIASHELAWRPDITGNAEEWLLLEFPLAVTPQALRVHVSYGPGGLFKLMGTRPDGQEDSLWVGSDPAAAGSMARDVSELPIQADFATRRVRLFIDGGAAVGFRTIDAVELIGADGSRQWASAAAASSEYLSGFVMGGGSQSTALSIPGLATRLAHVRDRLRTLASAFPAETEVPEAALSEAEILESSWRKATVDGRYRMLLGQFERPDDREQYGDFQEVGSQAAPPIPDKNAPDNAFWVWVAPYWYAWHEESAAVGIALDYGPGQAAGAPDTLNQTMSPSAWMPATEGASSEWLMVEFAEPISIRRLKVHESQNPGALVRVTASQLDGQEVRAWFGRDPTAPKRTRKSRAVAPGGGLDALSAPATAVASVSLSGVKGRISKLTLHFDPSKVSGYIQIDAVEAIDQDGLSHYPVTAVASSMFGGQTPPQGVVGGFNPAPRDGGYQPAPGPNFSTAGMGAADTAPDVTAMSLDATLANLERQLAQLVSRLPAGATLSEPESQSGNLFELRLLRLEATLTQLADLPGQ